jgi:uncharacterized protein
MSTCFLVLAHRISSPPSIHSPSYSAGVVDLPQALSGFAVGIIVGLTGVGGGSLMTPILVLLFGIHPATAVGTDLLHAAITKAGGTYVHAKKGRVDWRIAGLLAAGSLPAAVVTLFTLHTFTPRLGDSKVITITLGLALMLTAAALTLRTRARGLSRTLAPQTFTADGARHPAYTIATGAVLGVIVSLSSVGAGALGVTALIFLYPRLPAARIVASDLAHAVPLTLIAGLGHWLFGSVDWHLLASLLVGSLPGIYIGSHFAGRVSETILRSLLATMLLLVGGKLIAF